MIMFNISSWRFCLSKHLSLLCLQTSHCGGGSGGSIWIDCHYLNGKGIMEVTGGDGKGYGGGGSGGRLTVNYVSGIFHSDQTFAKGGAATGQGASEHGGPGIVFLNGLSPVNRNLRIDNKGQPAKVILIHTSVKTHILRCCYKPSCSWVLLLVTFCPIKEAGGSADLKIGKSALLSLNLRNFSNTQPIYTKMSFMVF